LSDNNEYLLKICILGNSDPLKSTIVRSFAENKFDTGYLPSLSVDITTKKITLDDIKVKLILVDTAKQEFFRKLRPSYYRGTSAFIIIFDKCDHQSFETVPEYLVEFQKYIQPAIPGALVGLITQCDHSSQEISTEEGHKLAAHLNLVYFETKPSDRLQVEEIFLYLTRKVISPKSQRDDSTDSPPLPKRDKSPEPKSPAVLKPKPDIPEISSPEPVIPDPLPGLTPSAAPPTAPASLPTPPYFPSPPAPMGAQSAAPPPPVTATSSLPPQQQTFSPSNLPPLPGQGAAPPPPGLSPPGPTGGAVGGNIPPGSAPRPSPMSLKAQMNTDDKSDEEDPLTPFIYVYLYPKGPPDASAEGILKLMAFCPQCGEWNILRKTKCVFCNTSLLPSI
jgi:small GTP-binding protein